MSLGVEIFKSTIKMISDLYCVIQASFSRFNGRTSGLDVFDVILEGRNQKRCFWFETGSTIGEPSKTGLYHAVKITDHFDSTLENFNPQRHPVGVPPIFDFCLLKYFA